MQTQILKNILLIMILSISLQFCLTAEKENVESLKKCEIDFGSIVVKNIQSGGIFALAPKLMMDTEIKITNPNPTEVKFYSFDLNVSLLNGENETRFEEMFYQIKKRLFQLTLQLSYH